MIRLEKQSSEKNRFPWVLLSFALVCALALYGCGGGGGGSAQNPPATGGGDTGGGTGGGDTGGGTGGGGTPTPTPTLQRSLLKEVNANTALASGAAIRILRAASSRASFGTREGIGHTTQSSYSWSGQTADKMYYTPEYDENGDFHFTSTRRSSRGDGFLYQFSTKEGRHSLQRVDDAPAAGWKGIEAYTDATNGAFTQEVYSDIENAQDADYLSLGNWLYVFKDSNTGNYSGSFTLGVSASGNDPFGKGKIAGLTGSATYAGPAIGLYMTKANADATPVFDYFSAEANLTADFGDASALGTVSGAITGGMTEGGAAVPDLTLGSADITNDFSGGNSIGDTSGATSGGAALAGRWAAKFFGNGAGATDQPGSIAGTFGANSEDDLLSFIGAFGAHKQ